VAPVNRSEENYTKGDLFPVIVAQGGEEKQGYERVFGSGIE
jgi:hypothetical protein